MMMESVRFAVEIAILIVIVLGILYVFKEVVVKMSQDALGVQALIIRPVIMIIVSHGTRYLLQCSIFLFVFVQSLY